MVPQKLIAQLRKKEHKTFLVTSHIHLEGDALGSELAMASLLRRLGKKVKVVNDDVAPPEYSFLPGLNSIRRLNGPIDYDAAVFVDCSDVSRAGKVSKILDPSKCLINVDHHISNSRFGNVNWVEPEASSASEMVFNIFKAMRLPLSTQEATLLYAGIMTDTGSFKYSSTKSSTHRAAAELLERNLNAYDIYRRVHENMSIDIIRAIGKIIESLRLSASKKVAWLVVPHQLIRRHPGLGELTDSIIHFARSLEGVEIALLFKEVRRAQEVRVNLRSRGKADVNALAGLFGGGGHKMASGCTIKGTLQASVKRLVQAAERSFR